MTYVVTAVFLDSLHSLDPLPPNLITHLGFLYAFATSPNSEIRYRFYILALADPTTETAYSFAFAAARWVVGNDGSGIVQGRTKYCVPTFQAVNTVNSDLAKETFNTWRESFHPIAQKAIKEVCDALSYLSMTPAYYMLLWSQVLGIKIGTLFTP
jgi:leukotriene-A4 hydrolase